MANVSVAVHGLGNIGKHVIDCLLTARDFTCTGIIRRKESLGTNTFDLRGISDFDSITTLVAQQGKPDVIILCAPSRATPELVKQYLAQGINTVDSFDIHPEIKNNIVTFEPIAKKHGAVAVTAAGWDPGTNSILRALFESMTPTGTTFTNFGRGRSMGHSVAARNIEGVEGATAMTIPLGGGRHSRLVYVVLKKGSVFSEVKEALTRDSYFCNDPLDVRELENLEALATVADNSHGVLLERIGASGTASNQHLTFDMRINNPALTAQVLVSCARATKRLTAGSYTLIDIPPVAMLPEERLDAIARLV